MTRKRRETREWKHRDAEGRAGYSTKKRIDISKSKLPKQSAPAASTKPPSKKKG